MDLSKKKRLSLFFQFGEKESWNANFLVLSFAARRSQKNCDFNGISNAFEIYKIVRGSNNSLD